MSRCIVGVMPSDKLRERERAIEKGLLVPVVRATELLIILD